MHAHASILKQSYALQWGLLALLCSRPVFSEEVLPTITVNPPQTALEELTSNPERLEEEELTVAHERSIADVLQGFSGLSISKTGGFGQVGTLFIRGAGGQGSVTLDDIPLLLSVPGFLNLDTLPVEAIQQADIERGPGAAYYPFQSLGGTIRLSTRDRQDSGGKLSVEGGSFGILRETLQGGIAGDSGLMTATLSRADAFDGAHLAHSSDNPEREPSHFTQGILRFSSDLTARLNWQGSMLYRNSKTGIDKFGLDRQGRVALLDDKNSTGIEESWLAQSSLNYQVASNWISRLQLGYTQLDTGLTMVPLRNGTFTRLFLTHWRNRHTLIDDEKRKRQWQITWGGQGRHEQGSSPTSGFSQERTMAAGFIDTQAQYGKLSGEAGLRVEHFDRYGDRPLFKTAAAWRITPVLTLRAAGGTGYRLPSYTELLFLFFGNPALTPERSSSADLGFDWRPMSGMRVTVNGFYFRYHDLITPAYDPNRGPISLNVADAEVSGMESAVRYAWTDNLETGISYTVNDSRDLNTNQHLPWRPDHIARIWGQQKLARVPLTLWAEAIIRSATWNDTANTMPVAESVQVNASIRYAVSKMAEVYLRGENLANNRVPQFYNTDMPGIAVYGGCQLNF